MKKIKNKNKIFKEIIETNLFESHIASLLKKTEDLFSVEVGSYPQFLKKPSGVQIVLIYYSKQEIQKAKKYLINKLDKII